MGILFKSFPLNTRGRDFAVGDVHGHFSLLERALKAVNFDSLTDRLFSEGDLVDRGPESDRFPEFLAQIWFNALRGNHEQLVIDSPTDPWWAETWYKNGGVWGWEQGQDVVVKWGNLLDELPIAMEVMTPTGRVGLVHADPMLPSWPEVRRHLEEQEKVLSRPFSMDNFTKEIQGMLWSRARLAEMQSAEELGEHYPDFPGVVALVLGHTIVNKPLHVGNIWAIDTGAYLQEGPLSALTLLNLHTFEVHSFENLRPAQTGVPSEVTPVVS